MDTQRLHDRDEFTESAQTLQSGVNSPLQSEGEQELESDRSSDWTTQDGANTQSGNLEQDESTTQAGEQDQWFCTLCEKCKMLIKDTVEWYLQHADSLPRGGMPRRWWHSINYLQDMRNHCDLCILVLAQLSDSARGTCTLARFPDWNATLSTASYWSSRDARIQFVFHYPERDTRPQSQSSHRMIEISRIRMCLAPDDRWLGKYQLASGRTDSQDTIEKILRWLRNCAAHETCGQWCSSVGAGRIMPSRLLEIDIDSSCQRVRLVLMEGRAEGKHMYPYVTLSHCWGLQVPARLLSHNLEQMMTDIAMDDLPPTFQDAITVTHRLGFRYLWIDALCIIQDSHRDWLTQSKTMTDIYANCALNIAATASMDSAGGLFRDRRPERISAVTALVSKQNIFCHRSTWEKDIMDGPLTNRAWVVQERFLAPRVVHFGQRQVHWECLELSTSESLPDDSVLSRLIGDFDVGKRISCDKTLFQGPSYGAIHRLWDQNIQRYAGCQLTFSSDRSVAVLGLSHAFARLLGLHQDDCVFGMWKHRFVYELMWFSISSTGVRIDGKVPSWSWCSVTGGINNACWGYMESQRELHSIGQDLFSVLHLHGINGDDLILAPGDSTIRLSAPMCAVTLQCTDSEYCAITLQGQPIGAQISAEIFWDDQRKSEFQKIAKLKFYLLLNTIGEDDSSEGYHYRQTPAFTRAIQPETSSSSGDKSDLQCKEPTVKSAVEYMCLLLKPTEIPAHFQRVAYVEIGLSTSEDGYSLFRWLKDRDILDNAFQSGDLPSHLHEGMDEYYRYKINLV